MSCNHGGHSHKWHLRLCHFLMTSGKYYGAIWIGSHVVIANHIYGLELQR